ncbi:hypothetical protein V6Z11_D04G096500 [Gossypium hirsutum]
MDKKRRQIARRKGLSGSPAVTLFFADDSIVFGEATEDGGQDILRRHESASGQQVTHQLGVRRAFCMERYLGLPTMVGMREKRRSFLADL